MYPQKIVPRKILFPVLLLSEPVSVPVKRQAELLVELLCESLAEQQVLKETVNRFSM